MPMLVVHEIKVLPCGEGPKRGFNASGQLTIAEIARVLPAIW